MKKFIEIVTALCILVMINNSIYAQTWNLSGNAGTLPSTNFIGTTDNTNLKIRTNNQIRINIANTGKVGIGNFSPVFKLDVKGGSINTDSLYRIAGVQVLYRNASNQVQIGDVTANIGIGTSTPFAALHVVSANSNTAIFNGGNQMYIQLLESGNYRGYLGSYSGNAEDVDFGTGVGNTTGKLHLCIQGTPKFSVAGNGNVGIGNISPSTTLDVNGIITATGGNSGNWNTAYSWGNHGAAGYLTAELDPQVGTILNTGVPKWNGSALVTGTIFDNGSVGIGTSSPQAKLQVTSASTVIDPQIRLHQTNSDFARINFTNNTTSNYWTIAGQPSATNALARLNFYNNIYGDVMSLTGDGNVCIGTSTPATGYLLSVQGKIMSEEMKVMLHANWPDYVFEENYPLMKLDDLKEHLKSEKHLPGMPSATEVERKDGFEIGMMQQKLLEKVEELTLYIITQNDEINKMKIQIENLK